MKHSKTKENMINAILSHTQQVIRKKKKNYSWMMMMRTIPPSDNKSQTDNTMCFIYVIYSCNNLPKKESLSCLVDKCWYGQEHSIFNDDDDDDARGNSTYGG